MPKRNIYIRTRNLLKWKSLSSPTEWVNRKLEEDFDDGIIPKDWTWDTDQNKWVPPSD